MLFSSSNPSIKSSKSNLTLNSIETNSNSTQTNLSSQLDPSIYIIILGGSYAGLHALEHFIHQLQSNHSFTSTHLHITLIERNSHFNHLYTFPRHAVLKGHSQKAFIPYDSHLKSLLSNSSNLIHHHQFQIIQAEVKQIKSNQIILNQSIHSNHPSSPSTDPLHWDYLIYALGSHLPPPLNLPNQSIRSKSNGIDFLNHQESQISKSNQILIVGGGPLGIQYATDIADHYLKKGQPKQITLIHSRLSFLPKFKPQLDLKIKSILNEYQIKLILGERVNLIKLNQDLIAKSQGIIDSIRVESIRDPNLHWNADLVLLCTGQIPNTSLMSEFCPLSVPGGKGSNQYINTHRTLQISTSSLGPSPVKIGLGQSMICECAQGMKEIEEVDHPHTFDRVFAIGDCIDGFGAIKAGHTGWNQAEVAVRNVLRLIEGEMKGDEVKLEEYQISPPMIRLTLGLDRVICQLPSESNPNEIEVSEKVYRTEEIENSWKMMWKKMGFKEEDLVKEGWD